MGQRVQGDVLELGGTIQLSPSSIKTFESCPAGFLYSKYVLPKIDNNENSMRVTTVGSAFHDWAEYDFDEFRFQDIARDLPDDQRNIIKNFATIVQKRAYFAHPHQNEVFVEHEINERWKIRGYIDRLARPDNKSLIIIDYKTAWEATPYKDLKQLMIYAYIYVTKEGYKPENITLILDYVKAEEQCIFTVTAADIQKIGNNLNSVFMSVEHMLKTYTRTQAIRSIPHRPGDACSFCNMLGNCSAYKAFYNPSFLDDLTPVEDMPLEDIIKEARVRNEVKSLNEEREKFLKRALLYKYEEIKKKAILSPTDTDTIKTIETYCSIRQTTDRFVRRDDYLKIIVPGLVKKALRNDMLRDELDTQKMELKIAALLTEQLPETISKNDLDPEFLNKHQNLIKKRMNKKYLIVK